MIDLERMAARNEPMPQGLDAAQQMLYQGLRLLYARHREDDVDAETGKQAAYREYSRGTVYSYEDHVKLAKDLDADGHLPATFMVVAPGSWSPDVWDDVNRMRTLNTSQSQRRKTMHVCPLQLDIVERIINRYSNPGDLVLDPFGGLGTVALKAVQMGRRGYTVELNNDYFRDAVGYLKAEDEKLETVSLFDLMEVAE